MVSCRKLWGEIDDGENEEINIGSKINVGVVVELALQKNTVASWITPAVNNCKEILLPLPSVTNETCRMLMSPPPPPPPSTEPPPHQHQCSPPFRYLEKEYCPWACGEGPEVPRASSADCRRALIQAAALSIGSKSFPCMVTMSVLETLADATDQYLKTLTQCIRTVVDREAANKSSGFPDVISKVFTELGITGLNEWYSEVVLGDYEHAKTNSAASVLEDVPQLHFPAAFDALGDTLGPGFQMLHSLESGELPTLQLLDNDSSQLDEFVEAFGDDSEPLSPSPQKMK